ncbi:MAG: hypothetical protein RJQ09_07435 [Cyclobacteriaceae bacterium]
MILTFVGCFQMEKPLNIFKYMVIAAFALVATCGSINEWQQANFEKAARQEQSSRDEQESEDTFIQSFEVVAQSVQVTLQTPDFSIVEFLELDEDQVREYQAHFKLATTQFFRVLFRVIISPNAP